MPATCPVNAGFVVGMLFRPPPGTGVLTPDEFWIGRTFSRHADLSTVLRYDDNRTDLGGKVALAVAAGLW